ncbi:MAG: 30S ribosomal protein S15 [Candidatus Nanoarchaeia archaeon]
MAKTKKSIKIEKPVWLKYTEEEVKAIVLKLADKGFTAEKIGLALRDQYGIPKVKIYGLKIGRILKDENKFTEPGLVNLKNKMKNIETHDKKNRGDRVAGRSLIITKAKLKKQNDYLTSRKN